VFLPQLLLLLLLLLLLMMMMMLNGYSTASAAHCLSDHMLLLLPNTVCHWNGSRYCCTDTVKLTTPNCCALLWLSLLLH
jgi:hypothetical protein